MDPELAYERCAWEALQRQAQASRTQDPGDHFQVCGDRPNTLLQFAAENAMAGGVLPSDRVQRASWRAGDPLARAARDVYHAAVNLGLIVPGVLGQNMDCGAIHGAYQFTARGLRFFASGDISLSVPGFLGERVREVVDARGLQPGLVPLALEAQRCWGMGCLRAATVMIGLASEEVCTGALDALASYPRPPAAGSPWQSDWTQAIDTSRSFYARWQPGLRVLEAVKAALRQAYGAAKPDWWATWEPVPHAIHPYAEAVRIARNVAAHSIDDVFTPPQVGLLLASLPTMLGVLGELTAFILAPPSGVSLPQL